MTLFELVGKIVVKNGEANKQIRDTSDEASGASDKISGAFKKIGAAVATFLTVDAIKNFGLGCIQAAADANAANSQFTQVFGDLESKASKSLTNIADTAGISENRMKGSYTKIAAFAKTTGMETSDALSLTERAMVAVADSAAFYDRSLEETTESLQSFLKGNYENDAALGLSCTETTRNAAANALYGKSFNDLSEAQKQLTLLQMVEDANKLSGALGQAARESDTWTNVTGNLKQAWTDFQAVLGANALPFAVNIVKSLAENVTGLTEKVPAAVEKFHSFVEKAKEVGGYVGETLKPIFDDVKIALDKVKDAVQPIIDKFTNYVSSGELAEDVTNRIKDAADKLSSAYDTVKGFIADVVQGFKDAVQWGKEHETATALLAVAVGTLTAAIVAYNVAQAIKAAGGIVELAQLASLAIGIGALTVAETAHTVATTVATAATSAFGAVMAFITSPITLVIAAIGLLVAAGVALYKNWDEVAAFGKKTWEGIKEAWSKCTEYLAENTKKFCDDFGKLWSATKEALSNAWNSMKEAASNAWNGIKSAVSSTWNGIKSSVSSAADSVSSKVSSTWNGIKSATSSVWNGIKSAILTPIESAKTKIKSIVDTIKGFFSGMQISWPKIKMPKFSISPSGWKIGDLLKGTIPKLSISWYKKAYDKAMVLSDPTIFGYSAKSGKMLGGGDGNGNEVVAGESHLMNMIGKVVEAKTAEQNERIISVLVAVLDAIVGGNEELLKALRSGQIIKLNEREFGRAVREYA